MATRATLARVLAASWGQVVVAAASLLAIRWYTLSMPPARFGVAMLVLGGLSLVDGVLGSAFSQTVTVMLKAQGTAAARLRLGLGLAVEMGRPAVPFVAVGWTVAAGLAAADVARVWTLPLAMLLPVYLAVEPVRIVGQAVLLLERRQGILSGWLAVDAVATAVLSVALALEGIGDGAVLAIGAVMARALVTAGFAGVLFGPWPGLDREAARAMRADALRFAAPVSAMAPIGWLSLYLDRYVVGVAVGPAAAGVLAALSGAVVRPFAIVSAALTNYFRPDLLHQGAGERPLARWIVVAAAIGAAGVVATALFGGWAVAFLLRFERPVAWAAQLLLVLAGAQAIVLVRHAVDNGVLAQGRSGALLAAQLVAVGLGIPLIAVGALWAGPIGAALGRAANEALLLGVTVALVGRRRRALP